MSEKNEALARRMIDEVWNGDRVEQIEEMVSTDYVRHDPALPRYAQGPKGLEEHVRLYRTAFPDLEISIEEIVSSDETVTLRWRASGTHSGELMGILPTGRQSTVDGIALIHFRDGKAAAEHQQWDQVSMLRQLGLLPARESTPERAMRGFANLRTKVTEKVGGVMRR